MNSYFQFKQFTIHQNKCAMKVCTDACLFGAWIANKLFEEKIIPKKVLDIGSGTGLLSLMLAQKVNTKIDAVELDEAAFIQSKENIDAANFIKNIMVHHADIISFKAIGKYDCILSNPPFFENQLKSNNIERNAAMHATTLSFIDLIMSISNNLTTEGKAYLLLPFYALEDFEKLLRTEHLFINEQVNINHTAKHHYFRAIIVIEKFSKAKIIRELIIKNNEGTYTNSFEHLLKDFYLNL